MKRKKSLSLLIRPTEIAIYAITTSLIAPRNEYLAVFTVVVSVGWAFLPNIITNHAIIRTVVLSMTFLLFNNNFLFAFLQNYCDDGDNYDWY